MPVFAARRFAVLAATLGLAACGGSEKFPPACPGLALLPDAADLVRYDGRGRDPSDLVADARITAVPAKCGPGDPGTVRATVSVVMDVTRGPASTDRRLALPYFVAVMLGDRVLDKQEYTLGIEFPPNIDRAQPTGQEVELVMPVTKERSAAAYRILVGFSLSPEDLEANRQRPRR